MSELFAGVDLLATRTIEQARPFDALSLRGLRAVEFSLVVSAAAARDGAEATVLRAQFETAMRALGLAVSASPEGSVSAEVIPQSATVRVGVEAFQSSGGAAGLAGLRRMAETSKKMRSVRPMRHLEAHESVIAWQGMEFGAQAAAALTLLLEEFAKDIRAVGA